ncbi:hypothetical protein KPL37_16705 [Clostridium frigoris]|uniref:Uncharacterized protein n=1 Tax=Clostridium frigoris TaxID=205327 RepID=A0ABS6BXN3_9CLOT|nr:hypothetical protein [Clostridium frigoris]MBU3161350.1 hypothetical protein [Clostridium frigoris]
MDNEVKETLLHKKEIVQVFKAIKYKKKLYIYFRISGCSEGRRKVLGIRPVLYITIASG